MIYLYEFNKKQKHWHANRFNEKTKMYSDEPNTFGYEPIFLYDEREELNVDLHKKVLQITRLKSVSNCTIASLQNLHNEYPNLIKVVKQ